MSQQQKQRIEILPFQLNYDGPAPIKTFFLIEEEKIEKKEKEYLSHFRGRKLVGKDVQIPPNLVALHAVVGSKSSNLEGKLEIMDNYNQFRVWQHDHPGDAHQLQECFDWMEISQAVILFLFNLCSSVIFHVSIASF